MIKNKQVLLFMNSEKVKLEIFLKMLSSLKEGTFFFNSLIDTCTDWTTEAVARGQQNFVRQYSQINTMKS